jgi:hypothetical protein
MFNGRQLLIATQHGKEKVIKPILENSLGVQSIISSAIDTDIFGTFTGEVARPDSPVETLRKKCLYAMEQTGADLAVASEGSFGSHPQLYMLPANEEWMIFIDKINHLEILARELSANTNFSGQYLQTKEELEQFAKKTFFPSHALILRDAEGGVNKIVKGIQDTSVLRNEFETMHHVYGRVFVETDMRAMYNPTRMQVIAAVANKLVEKINRCCPFCNTPGFDVVQVQQGLPCSLCSSPTRSIKTLIYGCKKCSYEQAADYPDKKEKEDPMYCDYCNP